MISIAHELANIEWTSTQIPALSDSTQRLLDLDEDSRSDPRLLTLFAQQDPVILARLLAMANSAGMLPPGAKPVAQPEGAIRILGVASTYSTMLGTAMGSTFLAQLDSVEVRKFLVKNAFTHWTVARNLARFLALSAEDAFVLQLAALLEPLGIFAALIQPAPLGDRVRSEIERVLKKGGPPCSHACEVTDYASVSALIAAAWGAPPRIVSTLEVPTSLEGRRLVATVELIKAKLDGTSQLEVLTRVLPEEERWSGLNATMEFDLVRFA